jgi:hypothetical protein
MNDPIDKARPATASAATQEDAALKQRKQFKKMNASIALVSLMTAFIIAQATQPAENLMASPARPFVWLFVLSGLVGVCAEFYFFWLQGKEGNKATDTEGKP